MSRRSLRERGVPIAAPAERENRTLVRWALRWAYLWATAAWALPLLVFAARYATVAPPMPLPLVCALLAAAGLGALRVPDAWLLTLPAGRDRPYRVPGVRAFGAVVPDGRWLKRAQRRWELQRTGTGESAWLRALELRALERRTLDDERTHWWWLLTSAAFVVWAAGIGAWRSGLVLAILNIPLNVYPILLQRDTRGRVRRIVRRRGRLHPESG